MTRSMLVERMMLPSRAAAAILLRRFFLREDAETAIIRTRWCQVFTCTATQWTTE